MPLPIAQLGQPVLRKVAAEVPADDIPRPEFQQFLDAMYETLRAANGAGLAAPQVFSGRRVFLAAILPPAAEDQPPGVEFFINPRLTPLSDQQALAWEGCLSFIELLVLVPRRRRVRVDYLDRHGRPRALELEGFPARVVQHENDHLDGVLTLDRAVSSRHIVKTSEIDAVLEEEEKSGRGEEPIAPRE
jgi:peptide deformylase